MATPWRAEPVEAVVVADDSSVGDVLIRQFQARGRRATRRPLAEIGDYLQRRELPAVVIDGSGLAASASRREAEAFAVLVEACAAGGHPLLMISDSRVFPTDHRHRYRETELPQPACPGGQLLWERERLVADRLEQFCILRTGPLISSGADNMLGRLLAALQMGGSLALAEEPRFCPTPVADLARVLSAIVDQLDCNAGAWGIYHYNSAEAASCYEFAEAVLASAAQYWDLGADPIDLCVGGNCLPLAPQPLLAGQALRDTFGIQRLPWRVGLPGLLKTCAQGRAGRRHD